VSPGRVTLHFEFTEVRQLELKFTKLKLKAAPADKLVVKSSWNPTITQPVTDATDSNLVMVRAAQLHRRVESRAPTAVPDP
jgi:hypothetical protein